MAMTYIDDLRFGAMVDALKAITETDDEARDAAITNVLVEIGKVAPASWEELHRAAATRPAIAGAIS